MRHIHRDQGDAGNCNLVGDDCRNTVLDLKLYDQVNLLLHQAFRVVHGNLRIIVIVENKQFDAIAHGGGFQAAGHNLGERHIRGLRSETEAHFSRLAREAI